MRAIQLDIYNYADLSKDAQLKAVADNVTFIEDVLAHHYKEITASYKAFCAALSKGTDAVLASKDDYSLTGICYDYDFVSLLEQPSLNYEVDAQKLLAKLKRDERRYMYSVETLDDLFQANGIEFLKCGFTIHFTIDN